MLLAHKDTDTISAGWIAAVAELVLLWSIQRGCANISVPSFYFSLKILSIVLTSEAHEK